jgi:hypothetical protein
MAQILDPVPPEQSRTILCCYVNATSKIQIARICNIANWYFERVVFPGQRLVFEAPLEAQMEIHTGMMASAILSDTIPCDRLAIHDANNSEFHTDSISTDTISTKSVVQSINTNLDNTTQHLTIAG